MNKRIIVMIMTVLSILGLNFLNVNAANVPSSVKVKSKSDLYYYTEKNGTDYISGYNFFRKELTDGTLVDCVSNIDTTVPAGKTLTLEGEITDSGLAYILQNGYPYKSFTGDAYKDYYITQSAIWEYYDETRGSNNWKSTTFTKSDTGMKGYVYELVSEAKKAHKKESASSSINFIILNKNMKLTDDEYYYVSDPIRVETDLKQNITISVQNAPSGTTLKNKNGEVKSTFKSGEDFYVYVPANKVSKSGNITLNASTKFENVKAYEYSANYGDLQNIGLVLSETSEIKTSVTLTYEKQIKTKLKVSKQDITSKKELPGATLVIKDTKGNVVDKWVSTNEPHYIEGLKEGNYTLTETIAPDGYVLSTETIEFKLLADGSVKEVTMYNTKEVITKVKISKQDITTKEELPGATLVIKDSKGNVIDKWVSTNEPRYITGLKEGIYSLTETIAPEGYKLSSETIEFKVLADGNVTIVVMYNEKYNVPITDLDINSSVMIGAALITLLGTGLVFYAKRSYQK